MIQITDFTSLAGFLQEVIDRVPEVRTLLVLSDGEDGIGELNTFFNQDYEGGIVAVVQVPQIDRSGDSQLGFLCSLMAIQKIDDQSFTAKNDARNETLKAILHVIGELEKAGDDSTAEFEGDDAYTVELNVHHNSLFGVSRIVNAFTRGWYVDFDLVVPGNHLLYPS